MPLRARYQSPPDLASSSGHFSSWEITEASPSTSTHTYMPHTYATPADSPPRLSRMPHLLPVPYVRLQDSKDLAEAVRSSLWYNRNNGTDHVIFAGHYGCEAVSWGERLYCGRWAFRPLCPRLHPVLSAPADVWMLSHNVHAILRSCILAGAPSKSRLSLSCSLPAR